jgi:hypothetical protein
LAHKDGQGPMAIARVWHGPYNVFRQVVVEQIGRRLSALANVG